MGRYGFPFQCLPRLCSNCLIGGIITSLCTSFENLDNHGHGTKLEGTCMVVS
jgi:hypothetical protein